MRTSQLAHHTVRTGTVRDGTPTGGQGMHETSVDMPASPSGVLPVEQTTCCIVGAGPAGAMLALLLARHGVPVVLLEAHRDFERDFRGDTLHPAVLELLDQLGLADRLLALRHATVRGFNVPTAAGSVTVDLFGTLRTRFPYITVMAQSLFLAFITQEAARYPTFRLGMGCSVEGVINEQGVVRGVRYRAPDGTHEVRAALTVAADGRFSRVRKLVGLAPTTLLSSIDVLWFRVSRRARDPAEALAARSGQGLFLVFIDRFDYWQVGCTIAKGRYQAVRAAGLPAFRRALAVVAPEWADRFDELEDWKQLAVLSVEVSRLRRWYRPGLLLIGDAAHMMSPLGGVGINYAIQDAVVAANVLGPKLHRQPTLQVRDLQAVQRARSLPTWVIQTFQVVAQRAVLARMNWGTAGQRLTVPPIVLPLLNLRWPRVLLARFIGYGLCPPRIATGTHERGP